MIYSYILIFVNINIILLIDKQLMKLCVAINLIIITKLECREAKNHAWSPIKIPYWMSGKKLMDPVIKLFCFSNLSKFVSRPQRASILVYLQALSMCKSCKSGGFLGLWNNYSFLELYQEPHVKRFIELMIP